MHRRIWGSISRRTSEDSEKALPNGDSPEASVARGVRLFCESGGPNNSGEEVLHLPTIVEAAESSPAAATEASLRIRKFLQKENYQRAYVQYNAIMLMRILADNPGKSFTRNIDIKFVSTVKELLRDGRDMSVQQILRETLNNFETEKAGEDTLAGLRDMWKKEKTKIMKRGGLIDGPLTGGARNMAMPFSAQAPQFNNQQNYPTRSHKHRGLPSPAELAQRVEEAKTSAKLLSQLVQSTPPAEMLGNELIKEFVERCQSASRSMQNYIHSDNPSPDEDTLLTLIETNDQLATAMSKHQRALLQARRTTGVSPSPHTTPNPPKTHSGPYEAPANPPAGVPRNPSYTAPQGPPPGRQTDEQNPFGDQHAEMNDLQAPMAPQYGMPPPSLGKEHDQGTVYRPGQQSTPGYAGDQAMVGNSRGLARADESDGDEEEVVRKPVQYRF